MIGKKNNQMISAGDDSTNIIAGGDVNIFQEANVPAELVDQKIEELVEKLRKARFFPEFDQISASLRLGKQLCAGELSSGSVKTRMFALAWCARLLTRSEHLDKAEEILEVANNLGEGTENIIAEAFLFSQKGDKASALQKIAGINSANSRSAGLMINAHHDGPAGALRWMADAGFTVDSLDSDGKSFLLSQQLQLGLWDEAGHSVGTITEADLEQIPLLHRLTAIATLAATVPLDFRRVLLSQVPFESKTFPLASDAESIEARRAAIDGFLKAADAANHLNCVRAAQLDDEFALWLELRDPDLSAHGHSRLEDKLRDLSTALAFVPYAINFGIELDRSAVEREIDRNTAISGGVTVEGALARLALAFSKPTAEDAANYIVRHQDELASHVDPKLLWFRQIELFSKAGLIPRANAVLDYLTQEGISCEEENDLRRIISSAQGKDPVTSLIEQYESTKDLGDLINLVTEMEEHQHWEDLCEYGRKLFEQTRAIKDAERLVLAFNNTQNSKALVEFLKSNLDLLGQSKHLQMSYAWGLYNEGALLETRQRLAEIGDQADHPNYHTLKVNLSITMGDWSSLSAHITNVFQNREDRSAHELMEAAQLALHVGSKHTKDLVYEAVSKAEDDASILATAYFMATNEGWEGEPAVNLWLERAAELSDDTGPLQRMSFKDILDRKPDWDRRESDILQLLLQGKIPLFLAAKSLNRTLIDLTSLPALANLSETDPRRRNGIAAFSGKRLPQQFDIFGKKVALDSTALLTLSFLKILDVALDAFEKILIPHSTLGWLLDERKKTAFHQPSRVADARQVRDLLATGKLERFTPTTVADSDLSNQVGDALAALIAEAEMVREGDDTQHIVVRPAPVHRLSSLMEEEADLSDHSPALCGCLTVVEKLKQKGQITAKEEKRARAFLHLNEKLWPNQPEISDGAVLYLDELAISYLQHLGLLEKLRNAGLRAVLSPRVVSDADALIAYHHTTDEVHNVIERIRGSLNTRIEAGQVQVGSRRNFGMEEDQASIPEHPTMSIVALAPDCDFAVVDDRFLNQHSNIDCDGTKVPLISTLDVLDALARCSVISDDDLLDYRTQLRRAGYLFIPVNAAELEQCANDSAVTENRVVETAELKAIRESVLSVRMSDWLQLPDEAPWLDSTLKTFINVLKGLWRDGANLEEVTAFSNWLSKQVDLRGWAHRLIPGNVDHVIRIGRGSHILLLLSPPTDMQSVTIDAYWNWVEESILAPIKEKFPDLYEWLVSWQKEQVRRVAETDILQGEEA